MFVCVLLRSLTHAHRKKALLASKCELRELSILSCAHVDVDTLFDLVLQSSQTLWLLSVSGSLTSTSFGNPFNEDDTRWSQTFPNLTHVVLDDSTIRNESLGVLLSKAPRLEALSLKGCRRLEDSATEGFGDGLKALFQRNSLSHLKHVIFDSTRVCEPTVRFLSEERNVALSVRACRSLSIRTRRAVEDLGGGLDEETRRAMHLQVYYRNLYVEEDDGDYADDETARHR